jgi:hypothetical protein
MPPSKQRLAVAPAETVRTFLQGVQQILTATRMILLLHGLSGGGFAELVAAIDKLIPRTEADVVAQQEHETPVPLADTTTSEG